MWSLSHHLLTLVLGDKLFRAPLDEKKLHKVLDVGTGTGTVFWQTEIEMLVLTL
jgi:hypothetical protein